MSFTSKEVKLKHRATKERVSRDQWTVCWSPNQREIDTKRMSSFVYFK